MARFAPRVHTAPSDIDHLHALVAQLSDGVRVALDLADGTTLEGIVAGRPSIQTFLDPTGREGLNAELRLEQPALEQSADAGRHALWVDSIQRVRHLLPD